MRFTYNARKASVLRGTFSLLQKSLTSYPSTAGGLPPVFRPRRTPASEHQAREGYPRPSAVRRGPAEATTERACADATTS